MGLIRKAIDVTGTIGEKTFGALGKGAIGLAGGTVKGGAKLGKSLIRDITEEELKDASLYERLAGKKLTGVGIGLLTGGTMAMSTIDAISNEGLGKAQRVGKVSIGDNLDRLVSYDGTGFAQNINRVSRGNPEVMQDIVQNTFDNPNQFGVSGDIVFALHNMREG